MGFGPGAGPADECRRLHVGRPARGHRLRRQLGERLPSEAGLATQYTVSRSVVREVLRSCEALGLTVTRGGKGPFVVGTHASDLMFEGYSSAHLMEARPGIESPAAGLAALPRTERKLEALHWARSIGWPRRPTRSSEPASTPPST
ncbi:MAG: GntR family transcriptional regulator [Terracoccus sp.]